MKEFWNTIQFAFAAIGGWLGWFLGGCDGLLIALILFAVTDYITGFMCAVADKKLSSAVGFKGICRKVLIFIMVGIANALDIYVLNHAGVLRTAIIFFYISFYCIFLSVYFHYIFYSIIHGVFFTIFFSFMKYLSNLI